MSKLLFTHRRMREKIFETRAAIALLLGIKEITWPDNDYALFTVMEEMWIKSRKIIPPRHRSKYLRRHGYAFCNG